MFEARVKIRIDLKPLERYVKILTTPGQKGFDDVLIRWIVRYKKYALAQFRKNSAGGGEWPPLKEPIRKRVKKRSKRILIDSETLVHTLDPIPTLDKFPSPGIQTIRRGFGVTIGFGGGAKHPFSKLSIARLSEVHHLGLGRVPVRTILVEPTEEIKKRMANDVRDVANKCKRDLGMS
jgi:hypothetical protein